MKNGMKLWHFIIGIVTLALVMSGSFYQVQAMAINNKQDLADYKIEMEKKTESLDDLKEEISEIRVNIILICKELEIEPENVAAQSLRSKSLLSELS